MDREAWWATDHGIAQSRTRLSDFTYLLKKSENMLYLCACSVAQSYLILCDPIDCTLSNCSVHGILQARTLEWIAISSFTGSSLPLPAFLHWQADSLPLSHLGSPVLYLLMLKAKWKLNNVKKHQITVNEIGSHWHKKKFCFGNVLIWIYLQTRMF